MLYSTLIWNTALKNYIEGKEMNSYVILKVKVYVKEHWEATNYLSRWSQAL